MSPAFFLRVWTACGVGALVVACIDEPALRLVGEADPTTPASPSSPTIGDGGIHGDMVLIPATPLPDGFVTPARKDEEEDKPGKGKGKDAGADASVPVEADAGASHVVPAFWLDLREVSVASYDACAAAGVCPRSTCADVSPSDPVSCVTLASARAFCAWKGKRLVRNDEFTAAAGGATRRPYPWGSQAPGAERLNACGRECSAKPMYDGDDGHVGKAPCGSFPSGRTPEGVFDLAGNVAEWVDAVSASIARGGSFEDVDVASVASASIRTVPVGTASPAIGFRCALDM